MIVYSQRWGRIVYQGDPPDGLIPDIKTTDELIGDFIGMELANWIDENPEPTDETASHFWREILRCKYCQLVIDLEPNEFFVWKKPDA